MNAKETYQKHQELLAEIESRTPMTIYATEIQALRGYALVGNLDLEAIEKRAEERLAPIIERIERFNRLFDAFKGNTEFITAEDDKFMQNYFYGDGEKDAETKELIDFIIKGEGK